MKQKTNRFINRYTTTALVFAVAAATTVGIALNHNKTDAAASVKPGVGAAVPSMFTTSGVSGWWQGATSKTDMALFESNHDCFTSVQYKTGTVDAAADMQTATTKQAAAGGTVTPGAVVSMNLQTTDGTKSYDLHQFTTTSADPSDKAMQGMELGYVQLANGYVKVQANCNTADQLPSTIPALNSVKFDQNK